MIFTSENFLIDYDIHASFLQDDFVSYFAQPVELQPIDEPVVFWYIVHPQDALDVVVVGFPWNLSSLSNRWIDILLVSKCRWNPSPSSSPSHTDSPTPQSQSSRSFT